MNQVQSFQFRTNPIQVINKNGEAWFIASEIATLFGYRMASDLTRVLDDDESDTHIMRIRSKNGIEQDRSTSIINESGFYHAAFKSRKAVAKQLRKWVTSEVLPAIRKTGSYQLSAATLPAVTDHMPRRDELIQVVMMLGDRLMEIHNWGSGNLYEHIDRLMKKPLSRCTYHELVSLIRKLHRETQTTGGQPIVAGHRHSDAADDNMALNELLTLLRYSLRLMTHTQEMARYLKFLDSRVLVTMTTTVQEMRRPMRQTLNWLEEAADSLPPHFSGTAAYLQTIKQDFLAAFPPAPMPPRK